MGAKKSAMDSLVQGGDGGIRAEQQKDEMRQREAMQRLLEQKKAYAGVSPTKSPFQSESGSTAYTPGKGIFGAQSSSSANQQYDAKKAAGAELDRRQGKGFM